MKQTQHHKLPCSFRALTVAFGVAAASLAVPTHASITGADLHLQGAAQAIQVGGFASQGYLKSSANDYLGDTHRGTFDFREYAVNASWAHGHWRIGAQAFGQKLGDYGDDRITLDWATVDYQPKQWLGLRVGRVKLPRGLHNESLDVDAVRPFVLLPQSVYDNRLRDFSAAFNGGMLYGNLELKRAGSLDYRAFYGRMPLSTDSGASDYFNTDAPFPNLAISIDSAIGGSLFWNTPLTGLRAGYSYSRFNDFSTLRFVPFRNANTLKDAPHYDRHLLSLEYASGNWTLAAEWGWENPDYNVHFVNQAPYAFLFVKNTNYYVSAARRINRLLEIGAYHSYGQFEQAAVGSPVVVPPTSQRDTTLSLRVDVSEHLILKLEGHYMDGAAKIFDLPTHPQPVAGRDNSWTLIAVKATVLF